MWTMSSSEKESELKCPACGHEFPFLLRIFLNTTRGHECPECGSILIHSKLSSITQYFLLILSLIFIVTSTTGFFDGEGGWVYLFLWGLTLLLLVIVELKSDLSVAGDPRKNKKGSEPL